MLRKWCYWGVNSSSFCIVGFAYATHSTFKQKKDLSITSLLCFMLRTLKNNNNITRLIDPSKYPVPIFSHPQTHDNPIHDTNNKGRYFYSPYLSSRGCLHWYRFHKSGFKRTPFSYRGRPFRDWWKA